MGKKKIGRPTDSLKDENLKIRIDKDTLEKLQVCSDNLNISRSEVIRSFIRKTFEEWIKTINNVLMK